MRWMLSILLFGTALVSQGQNTQNKVNVIGKILGDQSGELVGATVVLLNPADSVMAGYSITNPSGEFLIKNITQGEYVYQVSYLGFVNSSEKVQIQSNNGLVDLGSRTLAEESMELGEVQITADHIPIMLKKDTIEYNAAAFETAVNSKVEDLLKQLPGVEVEADGTIKAQGEEVNKILVDGKEFFGDDPQIASKNLPAEAVDKVQVFDKLSDIAEFTGIDDGERNKTINLSLKDDHKSGYFGDINGGYGTADRYETKTSINKFTKKTQASFLGSANNVNAQNFSLNDYINFSGGLQGMTSGSGMMSFSMDGAMMGGGGNGLTNSQSAGLNFNHDFSNKTFIETNYFFNGMQNNLQQTSLRENFIDNETYNTESENITDTDNFAHSLNTRLKHEWGNQDISIRANLRYNDGTVDDFSERQNFNPVGELENESLYRNNSQGDQFSFNTSVFFRKRLNDKGRSFIANVTANNGDDNRYARQQSTNDFYVNGMLDRTLALNQIQDQRDDQLDFGFRFNYTEPLGKRRYLSLSYSNQQANNDFVKDFYDEDVNGPIFNPTLSNNFTKDYNYHLGGARILISRKKSKTTIGLEAQGSTLKGTYDNEVSKLKKDFFKFLPSFRWRYEFSTATNVGLSYTTALREPSIQQLQPVVDNSNPTSLYIGNPDLNAQYVHQINLNYNLFDMFNFTNLFVSVSGTYTKDKITNSNTVNEDFVQVIRPINVDKELNLNSYASFSTPLRFIKSKINIDVSTNYNNSILFINGQENDADRWQNSYDVSLDNRRKKFIDVRAGIRYSNNVNKYSKNSEMNQSFSQINYYGNLRVNFLKKWKLETNFRYQTYQGESFSDAQSIPIWNASISRTFLKYDKGSLKLYMFDILDKNQGINRVNQFNYIEDQRFNTLNQYLMLSFTYSISGFKKV